MRYHISKSKEANTVELKYTDMEGAVDKTKLNVYEDGSDKEFLKLVILTIFGKMSMPLTPFTRISAVVLLEQLETYGIKSTSLMKFKTLPLESI